MKWVVRGKPHPAENAPSWRVIGTYRWMWVANVHAWMYEAAGFDHIARVDGGVPSAVLMPEVK